MKENTNENAMENIKVNVEIDYDKLAESIVRVQDNIKSKDGIDYEKLTKSIVKAKHKIKSKEENDQTKMVSNLFAILIYIGFIVLGLIVSAMAIATVILLIEYVPATSWVDFGDGVNSVSQILTYLMLIFILGFVAVALFVSARDISREKDRNYIIAVFSALTSLAALVVALVALKG